MQPVCRTLFPESLGISVFHCQTEPCPTERDLLSSPRVALCNRLQSSCHNSWWAHLDSNQGPTGYEPVALPTELWALFFSPFPITHSVMRNFVFILAAICFVKGNIPGDWQATAPVFYLLLLRFCSVRLCTIRVNCQ